MKRLQQWFDLIAGISHDEQARLERTGDFLRERHRRRCAADPGLLAAACPRRARINILPTERWFLAVFSG